MKARYLLAALDWNSQDHLMRVPKSKDDVDIVYSKRRGEFVIRTKARRKHDSKVGSQLLEKVFKVYLENRELATMEIPGDIQPRISKKDKPSKGEMWERFAPRFESEKD